MNTPFKNVCTGKEKRIARAVNGGGDEQLEELPVQHRLRLASNFLINYIDQS